MISVGSDEIRHVYIIEFEFFIIYMCLSIDCVRIPLTVSGPYDDQYKTTSSSIPRPLSAITMLRPSLLNAPRVSLIFRRGFGSTSAVRKLPSVSQGHTTEKPKENEDHDPQTKNFEKSREERKKVPQQGKKEKPQTNHPSAGIGLQVFHPSAKLTMQDERGSTKGTE